MDLLGLCGICGKPGAMFTCKICGRIVCNEHYDNAHAICSFCKSGKQ